VGAGLDVTSQQHESDHDRDQADRPGSGIASSAIGDQQEPGEPDSHGRDWIKKPDDQKPAEGIHEAREPSAPLVEAPGASQQEHAQARGPEPRGGHPGQSLWQLANVCDQMERFEDSALRVS
jgi:hypothetical protein